jgi:hypothetical protein
VTKSLDYRWPDTETTQINWASHLEKVPENNCKQSRQVDSYSRFQRKQKEYNIEPKDLGALKNEVN